MDARRLAKNYDEAQAQSLIHALNGLLRDLQGLLARSKSLSREVQYRITPSNQRTTKVLSVESLDVSTIDQVREKFNDDVDGFWTPSDDVVHNELRRRLACVVIFLRSKLEAEVWVPPQIASTIRGQQNYQELRHSGRKYINIARKLGGLGALLWLPLEIPPSTYERYLNIDDEGVFIHLKALGPRKTQNYTDLVQRLIISQLGDRSPSCSYYNLCVDFSDVVPASDQLFLVLHALGGCDIPDILLKSVRFPQRRWTMDGEISDTSAAQFGLPTELIELLSDEMGLDQNTASSYNTKSALKDVGSFFSHALRPETMEELGTIALKMICFASPPCYEGNTNWYGFVTRFRGLPLTVNRRPAPLKKAIWPLLEKAAKTYKVQAPLRPHVLETFLYFCERDLVAIRRMAWYSFGVYSIVWMENWSDRQIRDFLCQGPEPLTRRDHALQGRLHISQIENKIKSYDSDVPSFIYKWEAILITSRLQGVAARFFQSVGDFVAARASLEQFLSLYTTNPIRLNTRRLIAGRLADIYCEMQEHSKVVEILRPELDSIAESDRLRRPFQRLLLASVEGNIGLDKLDAAESVLRELQNAMPFELDDLHDQQLHMRGLLAAARIAHMRSEHDEAMRRWKFALQEVARMYTLKSKGGFTAAMIHMSLAHAQLTSGHRDEGRQSWFAGMEILRSEKCEFWIPIVPTLWLRRIVTEIHEMQGWPFRMMLPGGKPDFTWP
ncbi:hypothetical protein EDD36DRAFT_485226 [Exophiala viscosa]|uniref:Uncharacterized protein n=1 Tax=Exophiala viscosa TaxID=2486360 RepID=A0AAN6E0N1_9EURO|nr:hypothetical protein EDD36DRAFT_485226 [Exophiala viscosa]